MLKFSERKKLADKYREWLKFESNKLEDTPEAVIAFLSKAGYLKEDFPYCPHCERITDPGCIERCNFFKNLTGKETQYVQNN